jgi:hypothetical protein
MEVFRMPLPKLTPEQKKKALMKAQKVRSERAKIRAELKKGKITLDQILKKMGDEVIGKMRVSYVLQSLPRIGKVRAAKIMYEIGIDENRRVQGLGTRQIEALKEHFAKK